MYRPPPVLNQCQHLSRLFSTARKEHAANGNVKPRRRRSLLLILLAQQHNLAETLSKRASSRLAERVASFRAAAAVLSGVAPNTKLAIVQFQLVANVFSTRRGTGAAVCTGIFRRMV